MEFIKKYSLAVFFALGCILGYILITVSGDYASYLINVIYLILIVLLIYGILFNYEQYMKMNFGQILLYLFASALIYTFSLIALFTILLNIESTIHKMDDAGFAVTMLGTSFTLFILGTYIIALILSIIVKCVRTCKNGN